MISITYTSKWIKTHECWSRQFRTRRKRGLEGALEELASDRFYAHDTMHESISGKDMSVTVNGVARYSFSDVAFRSCDEVMTKD